MKDLISTPVCNKCGKTAPVVRTMQNNVTDNNVGELKPCPFCGNEARIVYNHDQSCMVQCTNVYICAARQELFDTEKEAVESWNRRADNCPDFSPNSVQSQSNSSPQCKPGDTVYLLVKMPGGKYDIVLSLCVSYYASVNIERWTVHTEYKELNNIIEISREDFGKTAFLDVNEAERKVKEIVCKK